VTGRKLEYRVIPPKADAEFVANTEVVLDTYATPYDSRHPVVCLDEQPVPLLEETRVPIPATKGHPRRVDYEYERAGVAGLLLFREPLVGWRSVTARERRTEVDWADELAALLLGRYAAAEKVIVACDNLNTHTIGALYERFDPAAARARVRRREIRHTPEHGSWLNVAECELSAMTRPCVRGRRFGTLDELRVETTAWQVHTNDRQRGVDWQFRIDDARVKLKSLYPKLVP